MHLQIACISLFRKESKHIFILVSVLSSLLEAAEYASLKDNFVTEVTLMLIKK